MVDKMHSEVRSLFIYTDGGSRGNPGDAAIGFAIYDAERKLLIEKSKNIGIATNNVAEYKAIILALEEAVKYSRNKISCFSDSQLVIKQINGLFKIKKKHLKKLFLEVKNKEKMYKSIKYSNLPRSHSKIAQVDKLVNKELDKLL